MQNCSFQPKINTDFFIKNRSNSVKNEKTDKNTFKRLYENFKVI